MPAISMFYGLIVTMYFSDNKQHHVPHIHVAYAEYEAVYAIESGEMIDGSLPSKKQKLMEAWIELHREELESDWNLAVQNQPLFKIQPLQ
jgi:hypothetical protein